MVIQVQPPSPSRPATGTQSRAKPRDTQTPHAAAQSANQPDAPHEEPVIVTDSLSVYYGSFAAVSDVTMQIPPRRVTAIIGPSGCGKSTLLRAFNRMNDFIADMHIGGSVRCLGREVYGPKTDAVELRRHVGMVFQKPNPFPKSIYKNIAWGPKINGYQGDLDELVERSLRQAALWEEVKDKLHANALALSGGQQQRLCIARAVALQPDILLMDEPCSALDPIATAKIEDLIEELKNRYTVVLVTHNMQQAARVSDLTAFMYIGQLIEFDTTDTIFTQPGNQQTEDYITGRFG
jgi:phosphate transport system ATP-binding protein